MVSIPPYKPVVRATAGPYRGAALVGTHSISLGWDVKADRRAGLKGFAIKRSVVDPASGEVLSSNWLDGQKRFDCDKTTGFDVSSRQAPFQRFRWNDYSLKPDMGYLFEIYPARGAPCALTFDEAPLKLAVRPTPELVGGVGGFVNRGVTSAFAYLDRFKNMAPQDVPDGAALRWLSRGLKEAWLDFFAAARAGEGLHVCIYEFFDDEIAAALKAALDRQVAVEIVYHAKPGDEATEKSEANLHRHGLQDVATPRVQVSNISHNKFVVHLAGGRAKRLLFGSSNFSENAFYLQTNAAIQLDDPGAAGRYETYFQLLKSDPISAKLDDPADARNRVAQMLAGLPAPQGLVERQFFSPVQPLDMLDAAVRIIAGAKSCVLVSAPFAVDPVIRAAIEGAKADLLQFGLVNTTAKKKIDGWNRGNLRYFTPSRLDSYMGRSWDAKAFGAHKIHTKLIIADPFSDSPVMMFGSANHSDESCRKNDENAIITRDPRLCAIMASEFLRMFDHYKSRGFINSMRTANVPEDKTLREDDSWMATYFNPASNSHKFRDRLVFSGHL